MRNWPTASHPAAARAARGRGPARPDSPRKDHAPFDQPPAWPVGPLRQPDL